MQYSEFVRRKILEQIYEKMSDEEKRAFIQLTLQNKNHEEVMRALGQQKTALDDIKKKQNWITDFGSDIAANFTTDGIIWLASRLFRK